MTKPIIIFTCLSLLGCTDVNTIKVDDVKNSLVNDTTKSVSINDRFESNIDVLKAKETVYSKGDTNAYESLNTFYLDLPPEDFLFLALYMANKYNYKPAYYHVYSSVETSMDQSGNKLTKENIGEGFYNIAKFHLIKGAKLGYEPCIEKIQELYPEWKKELK